MNKRPPKIVQGKNGRIYFSQNYVPSGFKKVRLIESVDITDEMKAITDHISTRAVLDAKKARLDGSEVQIICLCGSTKFMQDFQDLNLHFTMKGHIVLSVGGFLHQNDELKIMAAMDPGLKPRLDELHKRKIDLADIVYFINKDGYIGDSTRGEFEYALSHGKMILFHEDDKAEDFLKGYENFDQLILEPQ